MLSLLLLLLVAPLCVLYLWLSRQRVTHRTTSLPSWPTLPVFGNALQFVGGPRVILRRLLEIGDKSEEHNSMFELWFGHQLIIVGHKPEDIKAMTNAFLEKPYYYNMGREWLGDGLVTGPVHIWKRNVKAMTSTFAGSVIDGFQEIYDYQARKLVNKLKSEVGKPPFDAMQKYLAYATLETICQTAMGVANISDSIITTEYYEAFNNTLRLLMERGFNLLLHSDWIYKLTPGYRELRKNIAVLRKVSNTCIERKRIERNELKMKGQIVAEVNGTKTKFRPFLDIMLELSELDPLLTDEQIRAEVDTVIVGGQETTATTLMFSLLMLGCHKDIEKKLYKEVKEIFGDSKRPVEKEDLVKLKYCEAVIYESLRMYPAIPGVMRYADTELKLDEYTIPAGTVCVVNALGAGRSKRAWGPDALQFRPERWLEGPTVNPASFLPFSYGRRACIGKRYATALLKTTLVHCVRELEFFSEADKMELTYGITLRPISHHYMEVKLRK